MASTNNSNTTPSQLDIDSLYETIAKQQALLNNKDRDWRPSVVPLSSSGTPIVPMQITGSLMYDNTPNIYVAPAYGELKALSIKKDTDAQLNKSAWDKVKDTLYNLAPNSNDPSFNEVKIMMGEAIDEFDNKLKQGLWSEQGNLSKDFAKELMNKKGGKQFFKMKADREANQVEVGKAVDEYNPDTGTKGIRQDEVNYYSTPKEVPFVKDAEGNVIGGGYLIYPEIFKNRNLPIELDKILNNTAYFKDVGSKNGLLVQTDLFGKYGVFKNEYITPERIREIGKAYLQETGGYEYIKRQGEIKEFNNPLSVQEARAQLKELAAITAQEEGTKAKKQNEYSLLANLSDNELAVKLKEGLGRTLQTGELASSLLSGATTKYAYSRRDIDFINDEIAQHAQKALIDSKYKKVSDEETSPSISSYSFFATPVETEQILNPLDPSFIVKRKGTIANNIKALDNQIGVLKQNSNFMNDPNYKNALQQKADYDAELKILDNQTKLTHKYFGDLIKSTTGVGLYSSYEEWVNQRKFKNKHDNISRDVYYNTIATAIAAYADNDKTTDPTKILNAAGIGTEIDYTGNSYISNVNKSSFKGGNRVYTTYNAPSIVGSISPTIQYENKGSLLHIISMAGEALKKENAKNGGKSTQTVSQMTEVFKLSGATEKNPESKKYENAIENATTIAKQNLNSLKIWNPSGNPANDNTLVQGIAKQVGIDVEDVSKILQLSSVDLTTMQSFGNSKGGVYMANFSVKDVSKKDDPDAYKLKEKLLEKLSGDSAFKIKFTFTGNSIDNEVQQTLKGVIMSNKNTVIGLTDGAKEKSALALGNLSGVNNGVDMLRLYDLDTSGRSPGNSYRDLNFSGYNLRITARRVPGSTVDDRDFNVKVKEGNEYKTLVIKEGKPALVSQSELDNDKNITLKNFNTDLDIKAYLNLLRLEQEAANFNMGGGGESSRGFTQPVPVNYNKMQQHNLLNNPSKVQKIINKYSTNSPFSAEDYIKVSKETNVPIELLLAQGIQESNLGTKGMAARTKNVGNVGNNGNTGKTTSHTNWIKGLYAQANLLKNDYEATSYQDINRLLNTNFLRPKKGGRYAEESNYSYEISKRLNEIFNDL